jgi:hypothetical protein
VYDDDSINNYMSSRSGSGLDAEFALAASIVIFLGVLPAFFAGCLYRKRTATVAASASDDCHCWKACSRCCSFASLFLTSGLSCMAGFGLWVVATLLNDSHHQWSNPCRGEYGYVDEMTVGFLLEYTEALHAKCSDNVACMALTKAVEVPADAHTQTQFGPDTEYCHQYSRRNERVVAALVLLFVVLGFSMYVTVLNCISVCCSPREETRVQQAQAVTGTVVMMTDVRSMPLEATSTFSVTTSNGAAPQAVQLQALPKAPSLDSFGAGGGGGGGGMKY